MPKALSLLLLVLFVASTSAEASSPEFDPSPDPSRIVLNPTANPSKSQLITWRTEASTLDGTVEYRPIEDGDAKIVNATTGSVVTFDGWPYASIHHTARLRGLTPDTTYLYRVGSGDHVSEWSTFRTARSDRSPWSLLYFGDAQTSLDSVWPPLVGHALARNPATSMLLHAGDLINSSANDSEWGQWFEALNGRAGTLNQFVAIGNHERSGDPLNLQFQEHFATAGNGPPGLESTIQFIDYQGVRLIALDSNRPNVAPQIAFLKAALESNPNRWTVVTIHQPLFSASANRNGERIRRSIKPLLRKHDVDLVLQGHDHVYARGHINADLDRRTGKVTGPVFVVSIAGPKYYPLAPADQNDWTENGATRVKAFQHTSTYQPITFRPDRIVYRSFIAAKGSNSNAPGEIDDLLDSFTIIRKSDGTKILKEGLPGTEPPPAKVRFRVRQIVKMRDSGRARVTVRANTPGIVVASGSSIRNLRRKVPRSRSIRLVVRPRAAAVRKLKRRGRLQVRVRFRFRANSGESRSASRRITLIRARPALRARSSG